MGNENIISSWNNNTQTKMLSRSLTMSTPYNGVGKFAMWLWISCALLTVVVSSRQNREIPYKRQEANAPRYFAVNGRYGRSTSLNNLKSARRLVEVAPRNDRFFLGSRYGKRATHDLGTEREKVQEMIQILDRLKEVVAAKYESIDKSDFSVAPEILR